MTDKKQRGEGDYASGRRYQEDAQRFVEQGKHEERRPAGREAAIDDEAERAGRERAKEHDPAGQRDYDKPS